MKRCLTDWNERRVACLVMDGGLATELERMGYDLKRDPSSSEWSGTVVRQDAKAVQTVHEQFLAAGSDIIGTATYQTGVDAFAKAVTCAQSALKAVRSRAMNETRFVAGSLGPYGAVLGDGSEYRGYQDGLFASGSLGAAVDTLMAFHGERARALSTWVRKPLNDAGQGRDSDESNAEDMLIDFILFETVPDAVEAECIARLMTTDPVLVRVPWAISFQARVVALPNGHDKAGRLVCQSEELMTNRFEGVLACGTP